MSIDYEDLRQIAREIPEVKSLLKERRQIEQDGKARGSYTKLTPHLTPSNDKYHPKKHAYDKSKSQAIKKITQEKLKKNAKAIKKTVHTHLAKDNDKELSKKYKEFKPDELVTLIEKGHSAVIEQRKNRKEKLKEDFEQTKTSTTQKKNKFQEAMDKMKKEYEENKRDIERDRGFSR